MHIPFLSLMYMWLEVLRQRCSWSSALSRPVSLLQDTVSLVNKSTFLSWHISELHANKINLKDF